ncbi:hypothetical protein PICSAR7_01703 [Mycobacterium avium subsp. paratuberculosis]|nr:hypothetical protein PICSAR7_01703 [Mycobacterium avium subsp. paratuberculosis]
MTSAVIEIPCCLAHFTISTVPAVEAWQMCTRAPASRASSASRATIDSSAARGQPASPSRAAVGPSWATAPTVSRGSSACWAMSTPRPVAYSRARRITSGSCTQTPSSENIRTCAAPAAIMPISVSSLPARPMVTAPTGCTSTRPTCWPRCHTWSVTTGLSATGLVLAIANTAV